MNKLLHFLKDRRTEDTLTECICYLIDEQTDGGLYFVRNVFTENAVKVIVQSQFSIKINSAGNRIRPDIFLTVNLANGTQKHFVIEAKYGDILDESKKEYFDYFQKVENCQIYLLCPEYERSSHRAKMKELNLPFFDLLTFESVADSLQFTQEKDLGVLSFLKEHTNSGYKIAREKTLQKIRKIENLDLNFSLPENLTAAVIGYWKAGSNKSYIQYDHNNQEDILPLEFEFNHPIEGRTFLSLEHQSLFNSLLTRIDSSENLVKSQLVSVRRATVFYKHPHNIDWSGHTNLYPIVDLFYVVYEALGYCNLMAYQSRLEGQEDLDIALGVGSYWLSLEMVLGKNITIRFSFRKHSPKIKGYSHILEKLKACSEVEEIANLSGMFSPLNTAENCAIKILKVTNAELFLSIAQRITSSGWTVVDGL